MANNKVQLADGTVLIDLTGTTAEASTMLSGSGCYGPDGGWIDGELVIQHYYTGSSAPSSSLGSDGDIYLQTGA